MKKFQQQGKQSGNQWGTGICSDERRAAVRVCEFRAGEPGAAMRWGAKRRLEHERPVLERALLDEVVDCGFPDATIEGVCRRAGLRVSEFERQFDDLEDGYCEVLDVLMGRAFEQIFASIAKAESWRDMIRATAYAIHDFVDDDRRRARFMVIEVFHAGERAQLMRTDAVEILTGLIDQGRQELDDPGRVTRATAEALAGTMYAETKLILERDEQRAYEHLPQLLFSVVLPYVGIEEAEHELDLVPPQAPVPAGR